LSRVDDSGVVYDNAAWMPMHAVVPPGSGGVHYTNPDPQEAAVRSEHDGVVGVNAPAGRAEAVGPGTLLWSESANGKWKASSNGKSVSRQDAFGWTNAFSLEGSAPVHVHYDGSALLSLSRVAAILLWLAALTLWLLTARRRDRNDDDEETREELTTDLPEPAPIEVTAGAE
jgi:hypothetical protein